MLQRPSASYGQHDYYVLSGPSAVVLTSAVDADDVVQIHYLADG